YGPAEYGGGGSLDSGDKSRFYYRGMRFKLDWEKGTGELAAVLFRPSPALALPNSFDDHGFPETALYAQSHRYFTNCFNSNPTNGASTIGIWMERGDQAVPVVFVGRVKDWPLLAEERFKGGMPADTAHAMFLWCDLNGDGQVQPQEITYRTGESGGITVQPDLSLVMNIDGHATRLAVRKTTDAGVLVYDLTAGETIAEGAQLPTTSGGDQALLGPQGSAAFTIAPKPFAPESLGGTTGGKATWSYPSLWPGLHASHESPPPAFPGEVIGTTRILGESVTPRASDVGPIWFVNGNMGNFYAFTYDGLFVATLFHDVREAGLWAMPTAIRGMRLNDISLHDENFWPTVTQTPDGLIYAIDGARTSIVRIDGLESIRRIPPTTLEVTEQSIEQARVYQLEHEAVRQRAAGQELLEVELRASPPKVDGRLDDWATSRWATIDKRGVAAFFNSDSKPYQIEAAVAVAGPRLYAAFRTADKDLLQNSGELPDAPFKTGGALDLMIGSDSAASPSRNQPAPGDLRLLITLLKGKPR
ncbi:MAG TPA: hypothetical protein VGD75_17725, partial [Bradyrhizobium sp.]